MFEELIEKFKEKDVGDLFEYEPMYKHTTYKVGGPVRLFVEVKSIEGLQYCMKLIKENEIPYYMIGRGSNVLFGDKEYDGIVLCLNKYFKNYSFHGEYVECDAGVSIVLLASQAANHSLTGLEFASGIPGSMGGIIFMNAGAYKSEIANVFEEATVMDQKGNILTLNKEDMHFSYRHSILQEQEYLLLHVRLKLAKGEKTAIREVMNKRKAKRKETQPIDKPSAGSVFRNPESMPAWKAIDDCGLRGYTIGHAQVSPKHSNFIINTGYASSKDILDLITLIQKRVKETYDIDLHTEVRMMNW